MDKRSTAFRYGIGRTVKKKVKQPYSRPVANPQNLPNLQSLNPVNPRVHDSQNLDLQQTHFIYKEMYCKATRLKEVMQEFSCYFEERIK